LGNIQPSSFNPYDPQHFAAQGQAVASRLVTLRPKYVFKVAAEPKYVLKGLPEPFQNSMA
jgi:hypothetical protein